MRGSFAMAETGPSVHDDFAYAVDCDGRRLVLHTAYRDGEPVEYTDVVFHDVVAHRFEHDLPGGILFDVEEVPVATVARANADHFAAGTRYGWPAVAYPGDPELFADRLTAAGVRAFGVQSSYGLCGWVLAGRCERVARDGPAGLG